MARSRKDGEQRELVIQQCPYALSNRGFEIGGVIVGPPQVETNDKPAPSSPARARVATMLSIFVGHLSIASDHFGTVDKALTCWSTGDKALANLRLIFAGLPPAASSESIDHLKLAAQIIDAGLLPETLMNAIWPRSRSRLLRQIPGGPTSCSRSSWPGEWAMDEFGWRCFLHGRGRRKADA